MSTQPLTLPSPDFAHSTLGPNAIAWTASHGLVMQSRDNSGLPKYIHAPVTLLPTPFPRDPFLHVVDLTADFNLMIDCLSRNPDFLVKILSPTATGDPFTARLLEMYQATFDQH
eukprot:GABV01007303.1.p1 GENE.GABV01007303.1~~GABV01007303.1.p1  ORF type:complete len:114 (+),score=38.57 GABV01007303.1:44-385(+)